MGLISKLFKTAVAGGAATGASFLYLTKDSKFVPLSPTDAIFSSAGYRKYNPSKNPATQDLCIKRVPLSQIKPQLLEKEGKLAEAFCAGVWSGLGYAYQRSYLEKKYRGPTTAHQLWDKKDLSASTYEVGTQITDHFEVIEKTKDHITVRCGDSPLKTGIRPSDGLFEMSAKINKAEGVVEFGLKSVFYNGQGPVEGTNGPMPAHIEFLHRQYTKLWMETAVKNTTM